MKNMIIALSLLLASNILIAQEWEDFDNKSYLGGYYFAVCKVCLQSSYNDDNNGYWACTESKDDVVIQPIYNRGCAKGIWDAFIGKIKDRPSIQPVQ